MQSPADLESRFVAGHSVRAWLVSELALALAESLVKAGHFTAQDWAQTLGAALAAAEARGAADTLETYYRAVVEALEGLSTQQAGITRQDMDQRRAAWEAAYHRTPHGQPVVLAPDDAAPR